MLYSTSDTLSFTLLDSLILCQENSPVESDLQRNISSGQTYGGSLIEVQNAAKTLVSNNNIYGNCYLPSYGGIYQLTNSSLDDYNSSYYNVAA